MSRAARLRSQIAIITTFVMVSLSFTVRTEVPQLNNSLSGWRAVLAWLGAFLISLFLANAGTAWLWKQAVHVRFLRKTILGPAWIEGTWFFQSYGKDMTDIFQVSIGKYWYELPDLVLIAQFDNVIFSTGTANQTMSNSIMLDDTGKYVQYFTRHTGKGEGAGVAAGTFFRDGYNSPDRYRGTIVYLESGEENRRQSGHKLSDANVRAWQKNFRIDWQQSVLRDPKILETLIRKYPPVDMSDT